MFVIFHITGQASSSTALQAGALVEGIAELGWHIITESQQKPSPVPAGSGASSGGHRHYSTSSYNMSSRRQYTKQAADLGEIFK